MQKIKTLFGEKKLGEICNHSRLFSILIQKSYCDKKRFNPIKMLAIAECIMKKPKSTSLS
jgi:hypothetical protein